MKRIRVLLVDDQILFIESLKSVINTRAPDIEVVGIAYNGKDALLLARDLLPDIILLDIKMPGMDGVKVTEILSREQPETKIMILTTFDDDEYVFQALEKGAKGYLLKNIPPEELIVTIRALDAGAAQISPSIATKLVRNQIHNGDINSRRESEFEKYRKWFSVLSSKEKNLLILLSRGYSNKEIGERLHLAEQTVKNYLSIVYEKIFVPSRGGAIRKMIESGIPLDSWYD